VDNWGNFGILPFLIEMGAKQTASEPHTAALDVDFFEANLNTWDIKAGLVCLMDIGRSVKSQGKEQDAVNEKVSF